MLSFDVFLRSLCVCHLGSGPQSLWVWMTLALIDEDVPGPASAPHLDLCPDLPHHVGPQAGNQNQLELVPHLPPRLDL